MKPLIVSFLSAAALALALLAAVPDATAAQKRAPVAPAGFFGIHPREASASDYSQMSQAGARWVRTGWVFATAKPSALGALRWDRYDQDVASAAQADIRLLPVLVGAPTWLGQAVPLGGESELAWRLYLIALTQRYGPNGSFWKLHPELPYQPIRAWQIWNEPNALSNWSGSPDGAAYGRLLQVGAAAVRAVDPGAVIVSAGVISLPQNPAAPRGVEFLRGMLRNKPARDALSVLAVHPYAKSVKSVKAQLQAARRLLDQKGMKETKIWVTEIGWGVGRSASALAPLSPSPRAQQRQMGAAFRMMVKKRSRLGLGHAFWYQWRDGPNGSCGWCESSGLIREDGSAKPLLKTFSSIARR